uniref:EvC ciliary complex subunit 2 n=1 Tax=Sphenodon punctatus TaxID=8508 RepID=A0A8D0GKX6_SPHPU
MQASNVTGLDVGSCGRMAGNGLLLSNLCFSSNRVHCFPFSAVKLPLVKEKSEDHALLLTSAAPDPQWSHSLFALIPSWTKRILSKRASSINHQLHEEMPRSSVSSGSGITFQKCAMVTMQHEPQTAYVRLVINNTNAPFASNITDLILLDNITSLSLQETSGSRISDGFQIFKRGFLSVGECYSVDYVAVLNVKDTWDGRVLTLPAKLTFRNSSLNKTELSSLMASFTITGEEKTKILFHHGIHALGFIIAFVISLMLTCVIFFAVYQTRRLTRSFPNKKQEMGQESTPEHKLEPIQFNSRDAINEEILLNDQIIDILCFEESENMLQSLEDLEVTSLTRVDADLEAYRMQFCKDAIALLMKNVIISHSLSPHVEKKMSSIFRKQFLAMETEIQAEYERKMVALTAECNLEARKEVETQQQRERAANEEGEELMKRASEKSAAEYRGLLDKLHKLERNHMKRFLLVKQEEYFAKAYRQLALSQRTELHHIFFTQIKNAIFKGELKLEVAKALLQDYAKIQGDVEELMDFLQTNKNYHLSKRFAYREYLIKQGQLWDSKVSSLWNMGVNQIENLINKMERSGHLPENHSGMLLDRAQGEVRSIKQKLDHSLKQEKQKLHQKLIAKRRREMLQKKEQWKEQMSVGDSLKTTKEVGHYLSQQQKLLTDHTIEFEELIEKLDYDAHEELKELRFVLMEKAVEELRRVSYGVITQELLKFNVPKPHLQQIMEEHKKEAAVQAEQLEKEQCDMTVANEELLQNMRDKLSGELLRGVAEQKSLRNWEQLVFLKLLSLPLSLSEEELLKVRQEFHCCFSQMDCNLALPKIQARVLLQAYQSGWREEELLKVHQSLEVPDKLQQAKVKKPRSKSKNKIDVLKKLMEDKICIYEQPITVENLNKLHSELLLEREHQLHNRENKLGEYITSLQFQKTDKKSKTLEIYTSLVNIQALLLEELNTSRILTKSECTQILERHNPEIEELDRKLECEMLHKESVDQQQYLMSRQRWAPDGIGLSSEGVEVNADRQVSAMLRQAMNQCKQLVNQHRQSLQEEQWDKVMLEDLLENIEMDTLLALYGKELRLAAYLTKLTMIQVGMLHRLLNLLLPLSSHNELLSLLDSISAKYADSAIESDNNTAGADSCKKRKCQGSWHALENKVRQEMIKQGLEKINSGSGRKESLLTKRQPTLMRKAAFSHLECLSEHSSMELLEQTDSTAEAIELSGTGEKIFLFRDQPDHTLCLQSSPRKKKKNFLNSKKAVLASMNQ